MAVFMKFIKVCTDVCFIVLPLIGYIHQYMKIKGLRNSEGFSKMVSFILIFAFLFRIFFWVGERFDTPVLLNAVLGLLMQLALLHICVAYSPENQKKNIDLFSIKNFWEWPYFTDYFLFISFITVVISMISNIIGYDNEKYVFSLGVLTAFIEAFLGFPQMIEIFRTGNVETISYLLVFSWFSGDICKLVYYISNNSPMQLTMCTAFQLFIDCVIVGQISYYRKYGRRNVDIKIQNI